MLDRVYRDSYTLLENRPYFKIYYNVLLLFVSNTHEGLQGKSRYRLYFYGFMYMRSKSFHCNQGKRTIVEVADVIFIYLMFSGNITVFIDKLFNLKSRFNTIK